MLCLRLSVRLRAAAPAATRADAVLHTVAWYYVWFHAAVPPASHSDAAL